MKRSELNGGMQERLRRREMISYVKHIEDRKNKLKAIENKIKNKENKKISFSNIESFDDFNEPVFRRIRFSGGFF